MLNIKTLLAAIVCGITLTTSAFAQGSNPRITLNVRNVDVYTVLSMLAIESGANIVPDNTTVKHDNITIGLHNVDFNTALQTIELSAGLQDVRRGDIIFVSTADAINRRFSGIGAGLQTRLFSLRNADAAALSTSLASALPTGTIIVPDARTHGILVTADRSVIDRAGQLIGALDQPLMGVGSNGAMVSRTIPLRYIRSDAAATAMRAALQIPAGSSLIASSDQNALIVTGSQDLANTAQSIAMNLDQPGQQVSYEVRVVDIQPINDVTNIGVMFGGVGLNGQTTPAATSTLFQGRSLKINATINALMANGHGQTLATPRISVLNNHEGDLLIGETRPISYVNAQTGALQVQFIDIGVKLRLTPTIGSDGSVTTDLHPEFSSLLGVSDQGLPIISNRKIDTVARVHDGESIVLAGLLQDISNTSVNKVPWLGDIPVFGSLFRDKSSTHNRDEIVFIITPHIETRADVIPFGSTPDPTLKLPSGP